MGIQLTRFAARSGDHNDRAYAGSKWLTEALQARFDLDAAVQIGVPSPVPVLGWEAELAEVRTDFEAMRTRIEAVTAAGDVPVTALSRCAVALATLPAVAAHRPDAVVVWFDAHGDVNTPETTGSGYLGGLALSGPLGLWESGLGAGLASENAILAGSRDLDATEIPVIEAGLVGFVPPGDGFAGRLREAVAGRPVYVHLDCDVLDPGIVPTDYLVPDGLSLDDLTEAMAVLSESEVVGIEIGELEGDEAQAPGRLGELMGALEPLFTRVAAA